MMPPISSARRRARRGSGVLPPNPAQWDLEHNGLDLRDELRLAPHEVLDWEEAFALVPGVTVIGHGEVPAAQIHIEHFRGLRRSAWSGMAISLDDGHQLVVYNDSHALTRVRATLLEEFFHLRLGHPRTILRFFGSDSSCRTYDRELEAEAYGSGAAALVPYVGLKRMVTEKRGVIEIARHYGVSPELVRFRGKVTKLHRLLQQRS